MTDLPPHARDQLDAAARDSHRLVQGVGAAPEARPLPDHPGLAALIDSTFAAVADGTARYCRHLDANPQPVHVWLHEPEALHCAACALAVGQTLANTPQNRTCNLCGQHVAAGVHVVVTTRGAVTFKGGFCPACLHPPGGSPPVTPPGPRDG